MVLVIGFAPLFWTAHICWLERSRCVTGIHLHLKSHLQPSPNHINSQVIERPPPPRPTSQQFSLPTDQANAKFKEMASELLHTPINMEGNSGDQGSRAPSNPLIVRDLAQVMAELAISDEAHRLEMEGINRTIDELVFEIDLLERAAQDLDRYREAYILSMQESPLGLGPPSTPIEDSLDGDVPAPLSGAGARFVDELPDISLNDLPNDCPSCNICMEPFDSTEEPESPVKLPCGHVMGRNCIVKWLASSNSCPLCRRVLFEREAWDPFPTEAQLIDFLESTHPQTEAEIRDLLQTTRPAIDASMSELMESAGLNTGDPDSFEMELYEITLQLATIDTRLAHYESEDVPLNPLRVAGLRELMEENEQLDARLVSFRSRHWELLESYEIPVPRVGRLYVGF